MSKENKVEIGQIFKGVSRYNKDVLVLYVRRSLHVDDDGVFLPDVVYVIFAPKSLGGQNGGWVGSIGQTLTHNLTWGSCWKQI